MNPDRPTRILGIDFRSDAEPIPCALCGRPITANQEHYAVRCTVRGVYAVQHIHRGPDCRFPSPPLARLLA